MAESWNLTLFGYYWNYLLKRYFAQENFISTAAVEFRAAWRKSSLAYAVFSVRTTKGLAYVGMEMDTLPEVDITSDGERIQVTSEERTAAHGWGDHLAGNAFAGDLDYGSGDKILWLGF